MGSALVASACDPKRTSVRLIAYRTLASIADELRTGGERASATASAPAAPSKPAGHSASATTSAPVKPSLKPPSGNSAMDRLQ